MTMGTGSNFKHLISTQRNKIQLTIKRTCPCIIYIYIVLFFLIAGKIGGDVASEKRCCQREDVVYMGCKSNEGKITQETSLQTLSASADVITRVRPENTGTTDSRIHIHSQHPTYPTLLCSMCADGRHNGMRIHMHESIALHIHRFANEERRRNEERSVRPENTGTTD
jgi:hypothetical protein